MQLLCLASSAAHLRDVQLAEGLRTAVLARPHAEAGRRATGPALQIKMLHACRCAARGLTARHSRGHCAAAARAARALSACRDPVRQPLCGAVTGVVSWSRRRVPAGQRSSRERLWAAALVLGHELGATQAARGARGTVHARRTQEPGGRELVAAEPTARVAGRGGRARERNRTEHWCAPKPWQGSTACVARGVAAVLC